MHFQIMQSSSPKDGTFSRLSDSVVLFILWQNLGQAEISDLHPHLTLHQDVPGGQVSVDVPLCGQVVHTLKRMDGSCHFVSSSLNIRHASSSGAQL